jgi:tRNA dimethylallyltransferase
LAAPLIAVVGPTAAGKSRLGLELAVAHGGEIVSCDSLQVYRGLDIGSAKPTREEQQRVPHHLIDVADPAQEFSAAEYGRQARAAVQDIAARGLLPLVVGGSGLYLRALLHGIFDGPSRDEPLRRRFEAMAVRFGDGRLHRLLGRVDPEAAARVDPHDRVRMVRALEVFALTGRPLSRHHDAPLDPLPGFRVRVVVLDPGPEALRTAVEGRTRQMFGGGLIEEVRGLLKGGLSPESRPLKAIGYRQAVAVTRGELGLEQAEEQVVTATMRYAKRQRTWFRHQVEAVWCPDASSASAEVSRFLSA